MLLFDWTVSLLIMCWKPVPICYMLVEDINAFCVFIYIYTAVAIVYRSLVTIRCIIKHYHQYPEYFELITVYMRRN